jgi:hypothetical protein
LLLTPRFGWSISDLEMHRLNSLRQFEKNGAVKNPLRHFQR